MGEWNVRLLSKNHMEWLIESVLGQDKSFQIQLLKASHALVCSSF